MTARAAATTATHTAIALTADTGMDTVSLLAAAELSHNRSDFVWARLIGRQGRTIRTRTQRGGGGGGHSDTARPQRQT